MSVCKYVNNNMAFLYFISSRYHLICIIFSSKIYLYRTFNLRKHHKKFSFKILIAWLVFVVENVILSTVSSSFRKYKNCCYATNNLGARWYNVPTGLKPFFSLSCIFQKAFTNSTKIVLVFPKTRVYDGSNDMHRTKAAKNRF